VPSRSRASVRIGELVRELDKAQHGGPGGGAKFPALGISKTEAIANARAPPRFGEIGNLAESAKPAASHLTDFDPPLYNVWKQQTKTPGSAHFGNSEARWVDNLLYLYTEPFDVVVDPFAGGGSTIDVCRKRFRRYWVSDRKPIVERPAAGRALPDRTRQDAVDDAQALGRRQTWRVSPIGRARGAGRAGRRRRVAAPSGGIGAERATR
jgi:hypothetical protein